MREVEGTVEAIIPRGLFRVRTDSGDDVVATLSPAARRVIVRLLPGERVRVEISSFDPSRGRITAALD